MGNKSAIASTRPRPNPTGHTVRTNVRTEKLGPDDFSERARWPRERAHGSHARATLGRRAGGSLPRPATRTEASTAPPPRPFRTRPGPVPPPLGATATANEPGGITAVRTTLRLALAARERELQVERARSDTLAAQHATLSNELKRVQESSDEVRRANNARLQAVSNAGTASLFDGLQKREDRHTLELKNVKDQAPGT